MGQALEPTRCGQASGKMDKVKGDSIEGMTPLHKAVFHKKFEQIKSMLAESTTDVNTADALKQTPLILAVRQHYEKDDAERAGAVETIKLLIDCGANIVQDDVLLRDAYGDTTLHLAAMSCNVSGPGIMKVLLDTIAATHPDKVKELISENCENFGNTPLHWVVLGGNYEVAKHMVSLGARAPPQFSTTRLSAPLALAQRDAQPLIPPMAPIAQGWARRTRRS